MDDFGWTTIPLNRWIFSGFDPMRLTKILKQLDQSLCQDDEEL